MAHHFSFKTDVTIGDECYYWFPSTGWQQGRCYSWQATPTKSGIVDLKFFVISADGGYIKTYVNSRSIAHKEGFNEWRSRVIDTAVQQFNFKGNVENVFGPPSFNELLPMYIAGKSPVTAYMASMGLLETDFEDE